MDLLDEAKEDLFYNTCKPQHCLTFAVSYSITRILDIAIILLICRNYSTNTHKKSFVIHSLYQFV